VPQGKDCATAKKWPDLSISALDQGEGWGEGWGKAHRGVVDISLLLKLLYLKRCMFCLWFLLHPLFAAQSSPLQAES
jgi:hypothetical protein